MGKTLVSLAALAFVTWYDFCPRLSSEHTVCALHCAYCHIMHGQAMLPEILQLKAALEFPI